MRVLAILAAGSLGCFGEGPVPSRPSQATVLMQLTEPSDNHCNQQQYIGPIGLGPIDGYAGVLAYYPQNDCDFQSSPPQSDVPVWQFSKDGSRTAAPIGANAGVSDGTYSPRLHGVGGGVIWLSSPGSQGPGGHIDVGGHGASTEGFTLQIPIMNGFAAPTAIFYDGEDVYIGASGGGTSGKAEPNNPNYPCCGPSNTGQQAGLVARIVPNVDPLVPEILPITPQLDCSHSTRCLVHNTDSLIYLAYSTAATGGWNIARFPKAGTMATDEQVLATLGQTSGTIPVGFHATDANVVWAMSRSYDQSPFPNSPRCEIVHYDLTNNTSIGPILVDDTFDCAGISVDDESVYFTIVETTDNQRMRGLGIGRVHLETKQVESIRLGISGPSAGPRRVFIDGDDLIVADPFTIARIPKSALDNQTDFE
jgi:hypothetical protein